MPHRNLLAIALVGTLALFFGRDRTDAQNKDDMLELYGLFVDAVEQVEANYVRPISRKELLESALQGMLQNLDPHSSYFSENEWKQFRRTFEGSFTGIGVQIDVDPRNKRLKVQAPLIGSPAYEAGILAGDVILEVDGQSTEGITIDKAVELLQGRPGTSVTLRVLHPGTDQAETIEVTRAVIEAESVLGNDRKEDDSWDFFIDHDAKIGYIRITSFTQNTAPEIRKALRRLESEGLKGLILDVRTNPGGLLSSAVEVSDLFVDEGTIVSTKGRNTRPRSFDATKDGTFKGFPIVVLVNQHSASAAEIVSACLQDAKRGVVVGERTFGKGSVQNILRLEDGNSFLKLTVETYYRPSGKNIHKFPDMDDDDEWGVPPDEGMAVELSSEEATAWEIHRRRRDVTSRVARAAQNGEEDEENDKEEEAPEDRQLAKALEVIKDLIEDQTKTARQ